MFYRKVNLIMTTEEAIGVLSESIEVQKKLAKEMFGADNRTMYPMDIYTCAATNRSLCLIDGFITLIRKKNFLAAVPLVRMQLDNVLRFAAAWMVKKPHEFAQDVFDGKHIRNLEDRHGKKLTDYYLVKQLSKEYPWIKKVYENTSGYIHLSEKHIFNAIKPGKRKNEIEMKISPIDDNIPEHFYVEAIDYCSKTTLIFVKYLHGWVHTKNNPPSKKETKK